MLSPVAVPGHVVLAMLSQLLGSLPVDPALLQDQVVDAPNEDGELQVQLLEVQLEVLQLLGGHHDVRGLVYDGLPPEDALGHGGHVLGVVGFVVAFVKKEPCVCTF